VSNWAIIWYSPKVTKSPEVVAGFAGHTSMSDRLRQPMEPDRPDQEKDWWWALTWIAGLVIGVACWSLIGWLAMQGFRAVWRVIPCALRY
jgi:hypothetical protein